MLWRDENGNLAIFRKGNSRESAQSDRKMLVSTHYFKWIDIKQRWNNTLSRWSELLKQTTQIWFSKPELAQAYLNPSARLANAT